MPRIFINFVNTNKVFFWRIEESLLELTRSVKDGEHILEVSIR